MFAKQTTNRSKKYKAFISTAIERCEPSIASTGRGGSLRRKRKSSATPARMSYVKRLRNFNDQSKMERFCTTFKLLMMILIVISHDKTYVDQSGWSQL